MIYDVVSYNGEADLLELRLNLLNDFVDQFIIVEAPTTFCSNMKPLYFQIHQERFKNWKDKIKYHIVDENYTNDEVLKAQASPLTGGSLRWVWEYLQKESLHKAMTHIQDEDTVYIGDVDEMWEPKEANGIEKLKLRVYAYYLNMRSTEEFWGPIRAKYKDIKNECLNDIRNKLEYRTQEYQGWHFTNMGGLEAVRKKVTDQYNTEMFNGELINKHVDIRFGVMDYIGRDFQFTVNETEWPPWLIEHRQDYINMLK